MEEGSKYGIYVPHGKKVILFSVLDQWRNPLRPRRELGRRRENGLK